MTARLDPDAVCEVRSFVLAINSRMSKSCDHIEKRNTFADLEKVRDVSAEVLNQVLDGLITHRNNLEVRILNPLIQLHKIQCLTFDETISLIAID